MPNDGTNLLEVPGNRLPETGSRQIKILHIRGAWFYAKNDQPGRMKCNSIVKVVLKQLRSQRPRNNLGRMSAQIFQPRPKDEIAGRDIHHIGIFLNIPKRSAYQPGSRNKVKIKDLKPKHEVTAQPSRVIVYKQAEQLFGLRHKPITLQDALPKSDPSRDNLPRPDPLSLAETSPLSSSRSRISKHHYRRVEALTINPEATID
ncbi:hypothetical protein V6N13_074992 [Hibiscus sabdariffa]|uniref:Uncharacterized protein n=1 Tax=Hibiscus sabdariffa TaxID=183260 RepID=A0ABR2UAD2_9ROSI